MWATHYAKVDAGHEIIVRKREIGPLSAAYRGILSLL
jgi:hypothetical protein